MIETTKDQEYFEKRAEAEIEAAQAATHAAVVRAHNELASHYLDLVHNPEAYPGSSSGRTNDDMAGGTLGLHVIAASRHA